MQPPPDRTRLLEDWRKIIARVAKSDPATAFARRALARESVLREQDPDRSLYLGEYRPAAKSKDPLALRILGGLLLRDGRQAEALPLLQSALILRQDEAPPVEELLLALLAYEAGQPADARAWLIQARQQLPPEFPLVPRASSSRPFDWESWHETEVLLKEAERRLER